MIEHKHNYVENEIKSFVYKVFGFFDKHVDVEEILQCLVDERLEMDFPNKSILSKQDFRDWYNNVEAEFEWNLHDVKNVDVKCRAQGGYDVDVVLRWQALFRGKKQACMYRVNQQWFLIESESGPKIERYKVDLELSPTPPFFRRGAEERQG